MPPLIRMINYQFYSCPRCGHLLESLGSSELRNGKPLQKCPSCTRKFNFESFAIVSKPVRGFFCKRCRFFLHDLPSNFLAEGDILCYRCHHIVAFGHPRLGKFSEGIIERPTKDIVNRSFLIENSLSILEAVQDWDRVVLRYLNAQAQVDNKEFRRLVRSSGLIILCRTKYLGYLSWDMTEGKLPTVRQLFVVPDERRKGYATRLMQYFVSKIATKQTANSLRFLVESPNEASFKLLKKLGFMNGRCAFTQGL